MYKLRNIMSKTQNAERPISRQAGYTLIEMAIALIILGIITAGFFQAYAIYLRQQQIRITDENLKLAVNELQTFKQLYGYYPCPAPLTAPRGDLSYGQETDCSNTSIAPGSVPASGATGINGVSVALSSRTVTPVTGAPFVPRVRIGAIPFRSLVMDEKKTYDGYGSRIVYALTENMANVSTFNALEGGIGIVDASSAAGATLVDPPNSALYALYSTGRNRAGGFDQQGNLFSACPAGDPETENCDFGTNAIFRSSLESNAAGNRFDDRINFFSSLNDTTWIRTSGNIDDIIDLSTGNVGVGTMVPQTKLDIRGSLTEPEGTLRASGQVQTNVVCPNTSGNLTNNSNCFEPRNLAGDNTANPANNTPGDGMKCPPGTYMNGIQAGRAICSPVAMRCSAEAAVMTGVNPTTGEAICTIRPCNTQNITICSGTRALSAGPHDSYQTVTSGSSRSQTYQCRLNAAGTSVSWVLSASSGSCTCTPSSTTTGGISCGAGYSGTYSSTTTTVCPSGSTTTTNTRGVDCVCAARPDQVTPVDCPAGQTGGYTDTRVWRCPSATWGPVVRTGSCTCSVPAETTREVSGGTCPDGYTGTITQNQRFDTPSCRWVNDGAPVSSCDCNSTETREFSQDPVCDPSQHVSRQSIIREVRDGAGCTWGTRTVVDPGQCQPNNYRWQIISSPGGSPISGQVGPLVAGPCTYAQHTSGTTQTCSQPMGNQFMIHECQCTQ
jgi:prepilin-type N-terminal cleavage/methylation domain-containing protein